nr:hypothetical protein GCM10020092_099130 [Actinoplanes digitatis]
MAYGLGIVRLTRVLDVTTRDQWTAQLAWISWFAMVAAAAGALAGAVLLRRWYPDRVRLGVGTELALSLAAALGAGVVVPLTMQPARTAQVAGVDEVVVIAICAGLGALVGIFAAWAALAQAVARWSIVVTGIAIWVVAVVSVAPSLAPSDPLPAVRLGVFDAGFLSPAVTQRTALATMPALALLIGLALGLVARRRELPLLTVALAGLAGPALLTLAYLIAGPGAGDDRYQVVPYWAAMTAAGAGVLGSVLAAVVRRGPGPDDDAGAPGQDKPPLPKRTGRSDSEIAAAGTGAPGSPARPAKNASGDKPATTTEAATRPQTGARPSGPSAAGRKPQKPRRQGRRANVADAFIARPQPGGVAVGDYTDDEPAPYDAFARGRNAEPLTREPTAISAPLPQPNPISAPLSVTPAPRQRNADPVPDGKPRHGRDADYVGWVSGLGQ